MQTVNKILMFFDRLVDSPSLDPDDSRRRKTLNTILVFVVFLTGFMIIATTAWILSGNPFSSVAAIYARAGGRRARPWHSRRRSRP